MDTIKHYLSIYLSSATVSMYKTVFFPIAYFISLYFHQNTTHTWADICFQPPFFFKKQKQKKQMLIRTFTHTSTLPESNILMHERT